RCVDFGRNVSIDPFLSGSDSLRRVLEFALPYERQGLAYAPGGPDVASRYTVRLSFLLRVLWTLFVPVPHPHLHVRASQHAAGSRPWDAMADVRRHFVGRRALLWNFDAARLHRKQPRHKLLLGAAFPGTVCRDHRNDRVVGSRSPSR